MQHKTPTNNQTPGSNLASTPTPDLIKRFADGGLHIGATLDPLTPDLIKRFADGGLHIVATLDPLTTDPIKRFADGGRHIGATLDPPTTDPIKRFADGGRHIGATLDPPTTDPIKRFADGCRHIGVGRTTAYTLIRNGELDAPLKLGARACGWRLSVLDAFLNSRKQTGSAA